jgi:hypothetical protein
MVAMAGCHTTSFPPPQGGPPWKDADDQGVPLAKGGAECKYQAKISAAAATGMAKEETVASDFFDSCMRRRGY